MPGEGLLRNSGVTSKKLARAAALACTLALCSSCASYKVPTSDYGPKPYDPYWAVRQKAVESPIYNFVPKKREQLRPLDLRWVSWCLVGNEDDGIFGEYAGKAPYSTNINFRTYCSWCVLRNPLHNFANYVIGSSDWKQHYNYSLVSLGGSKKARIFSNAGKWPKNEDPVFDTGLNDFKPYLKLNPWICDFFLGWRKSGGFEIKFRADLKSTKRKPPAATPANKSDVPRS